MDLSRFSSFLALASSTKRTKAEDCKVPNVYYVPCSQNVPPADTASNKNVSFPELQLCLSSRKERNLSKQTVFSLDSTYPSIISYAALAVVYLPSPERPNSTTYTPEGSSLSILPPP